MKAGIAVWVALACSAGMAIGVAGADPPRAPRYGARTLSLDGPVPASRHGGLRQPEAVHQFAEKPTIERRGGQWVITFAGKDDCDATVAVLDGDGRVIRHLASGVLGGNAPPPFQRNAPVQRLQWDGKDDFDRPVPAGARLRVSLGLRPEFSRMLCAAPQGVASRGPVGMAVDRHGVLYIEEGDLWVGALGSACVIQVLTVKAFGHEGNYIRTLVPFRADCPPHRLTEVQFITTVDGRRIPLSRPSNHRPYSGFTRGAPGTARHLPVITADGRLIFPCGKDALSGARRLIGIGTDGSAPKDPYEGPPLQPGASVGANLFLALSPDEKYLYFAGAYSKRNRKHVACHAVYRVKLDDREPAKPFLGKEFEPGDTEGRFNDPRGVAVDAGGRIYVGDYMNDRVQVFDAKGRFLKALEVVGPEQVRVHPKTHAVYVLSVRDRGKRDSYTPGLTWDVYQDKSVIKFGAWSDWTEKARIDLPRRKSHMHDAGPILVLDASRPEPVLWIANVGRQLPDDMLWRVIDRGDRLERTAHQVRRLNRHAYSSPPLAADRRHNALYAFGTPEGAVKIDPTGGRPEKLVLAGEPGEAALKIVGAAAVGPEGMIYVRSAEILEKRERIWHIRRFNRDGRLVPFKDAGESIATNGKQAGTPFNEQATPFAVGPDGRLYVVGAYSRTGRNCRLDLYEPEGKLAQAGFIAMTRSGGCVRINVQGQLYAADTVRPRDRPFPEFYASDPRGHLGKWYGTVFRYEPNGGGLVSAAPSEATHLAGGIFSRLRPVRVKGAMWGFYGLSPMPLQTGCQCVMADFDADDWGRVWVPDAPGYCVAVLDSAGNLVTRFGAYGNRDAAGAGSAVPVPPIPLWSPERVAALDNDAFVVDALNCRIVQVRLTYAAVEELPIP
jgi:hypothetical protein